MKTLLVLFLAIIGWAIHLDNAHSADRYSLKDSTISADGHTLTKFEKGVPTVKCTKDTDDIKDVDDNHIPYIATFYYCERGEYYMIKRNYPGTSKEYRSVSRILHGEIVTSNNYYYDRSSK